MRVSFVLFRAFCDGSLMQRASLQACIARKPGPARKSRRIKKGQVVLYRADHGCNGSPMTQIVELPLWLLLVIVLFAVVTFASHFLFPSVRWFLRRRFERAVARLNTRLARPIEPFKLARRTDMIQRLIYDPEVSAAIVTDARKRGVREDVSFERARRYAREIVPSFSAFAYFGFGIRAAKWLATALYDVRTRNAAVLTEIPADTTVVFVMNHRSNMDYVLVTYLAAEDSALSYAVGEWARVWPLSRLIRSMGAYFIRRKSRGALYRKVLARYVQMATAGGATQAIFPEGGLSLDGGLMRPKLGLLSYVVESGAEDVAFVPVAISYDRVLEDNILVQAHVRGDRRFGARISVVAGFVLRKLWQRVRGRFLRFGHAAVVFGSPRLLSSFPQPFDVEAIALDLMVHIQRHIPALPVPIIAKLVLEEDAQSSAVLKDRFGEVAAQIETAMFEAGAFDEALQHLTGRGLLRVANGFVSTNPHRIDLLQYYARSLPEVSAVAKS